MVGFRNIPVHRYRDLDLDVLHAIVREKLHVFETFVRTVLQPPRA